jgi:hypothetical protein
LTAWATRSTVRYVQLFDGDVAIELVVDFGRLRMNTGLRTKVEKLEALKLTGGGVNKLNLLFG